MHGVVAYGLERYVQRRFGPMVWDALIAGSAYREKPFVPTGNYPDAEVVALVTRLSQQTGVAVATLLEELGDSLAPRLMQMYAAFVDPQWRSLELIEQTEQTIHRVIRMRDPAARPPALRCERIGADHLRLLYASERRMCAVARGIVRGVARHYGEEIEIAEPRCMLRGDDCCELELRRRRGAASVAA